MMMRMRMMRGGGGEERERGWERVSMFLLVVA
jgi:hypothetical protein